MPSANVVDQIKRDQSPREKDYAVSSGSKVYDYDNKENLKEHSNVWSNKPEWYRYSSLDPKRQQTMDDDDFVLIEDIPLKESKNSIQNISSDNKKSDMGTIFKSFYNEIQEELNVIFGQLSEWQLFQTRREREKLRRITSV
ncbi:unnamed protein product [Didymodactylos carnosus]|uniref:Uncharacterized protein n=1 Tax=Didymodactylos carnosus TaxID=1234261 RepID=A0A814L7G3_9BILA|nr:unnamed protein product [Didymodactylos carnosus]CAF1059595.1 unnamed protein product [Didymodactylos carnosus]CAF3716332.1 unnamed protein product [Didymodactylos carnosus]CAF3828093.1 unnamed protein product [Didymodactylos carnosus]